MHGSLTKILSKKKKKKKLYPKYPMRSGKNIKFGLLKV